MNEYKSVAIIQDTFDRTSEQLINKLTFNQLKLVIS